MADPANATLRPWGYCWSQGARPTVTDAHGLSIGMFDKADDADLAMRSVNDLDAALARATTLETLLSKAADLLADIKAALADKGEKE